MAALELALASLQLSDALAPTLKSSRGEQILVKIEGDLSARHGE